MRVGLSMPDISRGKASMQWVLRQTGFAQLHFFRESRDGLQVTGLMGSWEDARTVSWQAGLRVDSPAMSPADLCCSIEITAVAMKLVWSFLFGHPTGRA